jgi:two-component system response regulator
MKHARSIEILLVEDNPGDVYLTKSALRDARIANTVHTVQDGEAALRFLRREGEYAGVVRPDLVLLDLNLPLKDGHQVLAEMRGDPLTKLIPVVVLTSSARASDVTVAYELQANCYVTKPVGVDEFLKVVGSISEFWFQIVEFP